MKKSPAQDAQKLRSIIKSIINIGDCFQQRNIDNADNLNCDALAQAACTQFITNIYEAKKRLQDETINKLPELNKIRLASARHIASHDYDSLEFVVIFGICKQLSRAKILAELYGVLSELEAIEDGGDSK